MAKCNKVTIPKTEAKNWPDMDPKKASEIKEYVKMATFSEIMESKQHKKNTDQLTYQTTSKRLCYWCITPGCLIKRIISIPRTEMKEQKLNREELDQRTMHKCKVYRKKMKAQNQIKKSEEKTPAQEQVESNL